MTFFGGLSAFSITPTDETGRVDTDVLTRLPERLEAQVPVPSDCSTGLAGMPPCRELSAAGHMDDGKIAENTGLKADARFQVCIHSHRSAGL